MFSLFQKTLNVVTHDGKFHADEVFGVATLYLWAEKENLDIKIIRTRDKEIIEKGDIVLDVGGIYDESKKRFDHHQTGGAGKRQNGLPFASFGLVWKAYGELICKNKEAALMVDERLVASIDGEDNGIKMTKPVFEGVYDYNVSAVMDSFNPYVGEADRSSREMDIQFMKAIEFAKSILNNEISKAELRVEHTKLVEDEINKQNLSQNSPKVLVLEERRMWSSAVSKHPEILFVISKNMSKNINSEVEEWTIKVAEDNPMDHSTRRASFPEAWGGKRDKDLEEISGVKNAVFCHSGLWFAAAKTREAALELANKALSV